MIFYEKEFNAAIFDMDGTMFDTERLRFKMLKQASAEIYGEEISDQLLYDSLGVNAVTAENLAKETYGPDYPYQKIRERADILERQYVRDNGVPVKNGIYNILERLKKNNIFIALATSSRREIAEEYLINAKVLRYFDILVCGDEVKKGKPDPEIFLKAASELNCDPSECLIFEDSQNGLLSASTAGGLPIFIKDIKVPEPEILKLAFKAYDKTTSFLKDFIPFTPAMSMPELNEHFPLSEENIIAGIHGFGAIGGGYLAQIFSHWDGYTRPSQILAAGHNPLIRSLVNSLGKYRVKYESLAYFQTISNIKVIDMDNEEDMLAMYKNSSIIGLSLPEQVIRLQAKTIAKGLLNRYENGEEELTILIVMNKINAARFVRNHVTTALKTLTTADNAKKIIHRTYFIETVVNRMVSKVPEDFIISKLKNDMYQLHKNILDLPGDIKKIIAHSDFFIPQKKKSKKSTKPEEIAFQSVSISESLSSLSQLADVLSDVNFTLFSSEPDMPIYANSGSPIVERLRQVTIVEDIHAMQEIKNKLSNGTHAIIAWYSILLGYKTIGQGMGDEKVFKLAQHIMKFEIKPALLIENPAYKKMMNSFINSFIKRCRVSFKDRCIRVGRDPMRKLQSGERIIGAIQMAQKYNIDTGGLEFGAACAILYSIMCKTTSDTECNKVKLLYKKRNLVEDVLTYNGEYNKGTYNGLDPEHDKELILRIQDKFNTLKSTFYPSEL